MNILEKEIEQIIWETLVENPKLLTERGLWGINNRLEYFQQLDLGDYGRADIVGVSVNKEDKEIDIDVYELKRDKIDLNTLLQSIRYVRGLQVLFEQIAEDYLVSFEIFLIGKSIDSCGDFCFATDVFNNVSFYTYSIDLIKGIRFSHKYGYAISGGSLGTSKSVLTNMIAELQEPDEETVNPDIIEDIQLEETDSLPF